MSTGRTVECYVTIHDQELVQECEWTGQFDSIDHTYLFVGPRPVDKLDGLKVIVARDYEPNFEHWPHFYDFTGWWVLARYGLLYADVAVMLQYDMHVLDPFLAEHVTDLLEPGPGMVAFTAGHRLAGNFMLGITGFEERYRQGLMRLGADMDTWPDFNEWPCTQGTAWRRTELAAFMTWVEPLFDLWADSMWAGHLMERMPKAWTVESGLPERYLPGAIKHLSQDCHGTCHLMAGEVGVWQERSSTFGR